ncbi:MAG: glycerophosphodiester phosphodiesterase [Sporichthyaceae bacterium]
MGNFRRTLRKPFRGDTGAVVKAMLAAAVLAGPALAAGASAQAAPEPAVAAPPPVLAPVKAPLALPSPQIIGHRGARDLGPENTLEGIRAAFLAGADAVEFDVNFTRDRRIVLMHDWELQRTTNCAGVVTRKTYAQIAKCHTANGAKVPSLTAALAEVAAHHGRAYVHVKRAQNLVEARKLVRLVAASGLGKRATFIASHQVILDRLETAGAKRLGYVFQDPAGWKTDYPVLVPFNVRITKALVAQARQRGQFVVAVESRPFGVAQVATLGLSGFMANDLERSLWELAGQAPKLRDNGWG